LKNSLFKPILQTLKLKRDMLQLKSKPKEIEYHMQQVEMLAMSEDECQKINKIMALKELISDPSIKELIEEDLKDESWIEATNILINTCNKRQAKSLVLQEHIKQCKNFMVFRYIEDKLLYCKAIIVNRNPWSFEELDPSGQKSPWVLTKFVKIFDESELPVILSSVMTEESFEIDRDWLYKNKTAIYSDDIFEDIDFLIKRKKRSSS
jgi:hypothetical protein